MRPALSRRTATSNDARAACPSCKPFPLCSASKRFVARPPVVATRLSLSSPAASRVVAGRARANKRSLRASLWPCGLQRCVSPRRDFQRCPCRVPTSQTVVPILCRQTLRCPAFRCRPASLSPSPAASRGVPARATLEVAARRATSHASRVPCSGRAVFDDMARTLVAHRDVKQCLRRVPNSQAVAPMLCRQKSVSLPRRPPWPHVFLARRRRRRVALPRAQRSKFAARRATPRACRSLGFGLAFCDDADSTIAPRRDVHRCPRLVPNAQTVVLILCRQERVVARPPAPRRSRPSPAASRGAPARATL